MHQAVPIDPIEATPHDGATPVLRLLSQPVDSTSAGSEQAAPAGEDVALTSAQIGPFPRISVRDAIATSAVEGAELRSLITHETRRELPRVLARNLLVDALAPEMKRWEQMFLREHGWDAEVALEGSMRVGNFRGAKPSLNPELNGTLVIDVDLGLRLPDEIDLTDLAVINAVEQVTDSKHWDNFLWDYWGVDFPAGVYFAYTRVPALLPLVGTDLVELEFVIRQKEGTVAFSDYWDRIFTREEIQAQVEEKSAAARSDDKNAYLVVKAQHNADARYRIMFGWHMKTLDGMPAGQRSMLSSWFTWSTRELDGVRPRPPTEKSFPWLRECWAQAERLNLLFKRTGESGDPHQQQD